MVVQLVGYGLMLQNVVVEVFFGDIIIIYIVLCEQVCEKIWCSRVKYVWWLGVNVIIGMCYDVIDVMIGLIEVLCYGMVVVVELLC